MACMKMKNGSGGGGGSTHRDKTMATGQQGRGSAEAVSETDSRAAPYPDNVMASGSYPLQSWADRMHRMGILSDMGFYSLTYPDGKAMVQEVLSSLGWASVTNARNVHPYQSIFFWCHSYTAKEVTEWRQGSRLSGLQFLSSLPNVICLHNKKMLQKLIRQYEVAVVNAGTGAPAYLRFPGDITETNSDTYLPKTLFNLTASELRHIAEACFASNSLWIAKPLSQNCGRGISLVRTREQLFELEDRLPSVIIQDYIRNPLTLDGRKSDMRVYLLLVCPEQGHLMAFYHPGFVRLSLRPYVEEADDLAVHLTNQSVAKATSEWAERRDQSTWTPAEMNAHLNARIAGEKATAAAAAAAAAVELEAAAAEPTGFQFQRDHVFKLLHPAMRRILGIVSRAAFPKVSLVGGCFEFLGCDFMMDTDGRVWLIEINCYPGMATSTSLLKRMKPLIVHEAICLAMECISKQYQGKPMRPLESLRQFQLLWDSED